MVSIKGAAMAATILGVVAATACGKQENYAADTAAAAMQSADSARVSNTAGVAPNTTRKAAASRPAAKKTATKTTTTKKTATKQTVTKKKTPTKPTYPAAVHR